MAYSNKLILSKTLILNCIQSDFRISFCCVGFVAFRRISITTSSVKKSDMPLSAQDSFLKFSNVLPSVGFPTEVLPCRI